METVIIGNQRIVIPPEVRAAGDAAVVAFLEDQINPKSTKPKAKE